MAYGHYRLIKHFQRPSDATSSALMEGGMNISTLSEREQLIWTVTTSRAITVVRPHRIHCCRHDNDAERGGLASVIPGLRRADAGALRSR